MNPLPLYHPHYWELQVVLCKRAFPATSNQILDHALLFVRLLVEKGPKQFFFLVRSFPNTIYFDGGPYPYRFHFQIKLRKHEDVVDFCICSDRDLLPRIFTNFNESVDYFLKQVELFQSLGNSDRFQCFN